MSVHKVNEVKLNSIPYPIKGMVAPKLVATFAEKQVVGDYTMDSDPFSSSFVVAGDQRGGMLIEEMDEEKHTDRFWWATVDTRFKRQITLLPLATSLTIPGDITSPTITNANCEGTDGWTNGARSTNFKHAGNSSWLAGASETTQVVDADPATSGRAGKPFLFEMWIYNDSTGGTPSGKIGINDGVTTTYSVTVTVTDVWTRVRVIKLIAAAATQIQLLSNGTNAYTYFDDAVLTAQTIGNATDFAEFNSAVYAAMGNTLVKLNAANTAVTAVGVFPATITKLVLANTNQLLLYLGDSANYWWMTTAEAFSETNVALADNGIRWDGKTWKVAVDGRLWYATAPANATPSWTVGDGSGGLDDYNQTPKSFEVYRDADGAFVIVGGTTSGLWVYSFADLKWLETELTLPTHTRTGLGLVTWHSALYISGGLSVTEYIAGQTAQISEVGLNREGGMPKTKGGEIVKFIKGYEEIFALLDSTHESTDSHSRVLAYDGKGWRPLWETATASTVLYSGIVTSVNKHQILFSGSYSTSKPIYSISLQRAMLQPKKVTGYTYAASGVLVSSWFDASWFFGNKTALQLRVIARDLTSTVKIVVKYRLDRSNMADIEAGWTTLGTLTSNGETAYTFGTNGVGVNFKSIQFRFELSRDSTTTNSPVLESAVLVYDKIIPRRWGWSFTIDCSKSYKNRSPNQLLDLVTTAAELEVLMPFEFDETTRYVKIIDVQGNRLSGDAKQGEYNVVVMEAT